MKTNRFEDIQQFNCDTNYQDMAKVLTDNCIGDFKIDHFEVDRSNFKAKLDGIAPGSYVRLLHNNECVMSNTDMEKRTNNLFCNNVNGDILIGGLGIGMIILAIQDKENVNSITVLEKSSEVIELVAHQLPLNSKVKIIQADVFEWKPEKGVRFDCIYMDIWPYINRTVYEREMKPLKRKYARYLKSKDLSPNRFNACWAEYYAKSDKRF